MSNVSAQVESSSGQGLSGEEVTVGMTNELRYVPEEVTIMVGQTVVWTNTSTLVHTVTADPLLAQRRRDVVLPEGARRSVRGRSRRGDLPPHVRRAGLVRVLLHPA